jgi:phosphoribosylaminoimidazole-succinocarboxamide synthase
MESQLILETSIDQWELKRGKVRDVYDLGDRLLIVSTDRISAFDWVLPNGIPEKGKVLTQISKFWFDKIDEANHVISMHPSEILDEETVQKLDLNGRSMIVKKAKVVPIECVVRGYLSGSGWKEYQQSGTVCGIRLPEGLVESDKLPEPIFTPATKEDEGHDENISFERMIEEVGEEVATELRDRSLAIYQQGAEFAATKGIILADTKFEWGWDGDKLILIDEVLTPDSSRFWLAEQYKPGGAQPSFDKQPVRDWLAGTDWDKNSTPPELPAEVVQQTHDRYVEALKMLSGKGLA